METLHDCHSRQVLDAAGTRFFCLHPGVHTPGQRVTSRICRLCKLWREPPPAAARAIGNVQQGLVAGRRAACRDLGGETGLRDCRTCGGRVRVKVFACSHPAHGETTLAECGRCADYEAREQ